MSDVEPAWVIEKTSGGYGVLRSAAGSLRVKTTVVRPDGYSAPEPRRRIDWSEPHAEGEWDLPAADKVGDD
jgi:hypothetical protein